MLLKNLKLLDRKIKQQKILEYNDLIPPSLPTQSCSPVMWVRAYMDMSTDRQADRPYSQLLAAVLAQNTVPS